MQELIHDYIAELRDTLSGLPMGQIEKVIERLIEAQWTRSTVYVFGNGGSAATASHFACDLGKNAALPGLPRMRVISLTDNAGAVTAWANDTAYENIFSEQLRALVDPGDVVIGISGSGRSGNVLRGMAVARQAGATTIGLTGFEGGELAGMVDIPVVVPSDSMERIEDVHLILEHVIVSTIREFQRQQLGLILRLRPELKDGREQGVVTEVVQMVAAD